MQTTAAPLIRNLSMRLLIGSVAISALLGIWAILAGDFGWFEVRVLLTSIIVTVTSICGLGCGAALAAGRGRTVPRAGIGLASAGGILLLIGMWVEINDEAYWKLTVPICAYAAACTHVCLLTLARLSSRYRGWFFAAIGASLVVATLVAAWVLFEIDDEGFFRLLGAASIIAAALTVLMPILHRVSASTVAPAGGDDIARLEAEIVRLRTKLEELEGRRAALLGAGTGSG